MRGLVEVPHRPSHLESLQDGAPPRDERVVAHGSASSRPPATESPIQEALSSVEAIKAIKAVKAVPKAGGPAPAGDIVPVPVTITAMVMACASPRATDLHVSVILDGVMRRISRTIALLGVIRECVLLGRHGRLPLSRGESMSLAMD